MARSKNSNQWMQEHFDDEYVKKAQVFGYRSRSIFKLMEIQEKDQIIKPGMSVIDLGAAPGSWSEYASKIVGKKNKVLALDLLPIDPIHGVDFIQGDFREEDVLQALYKVLNGVPIDLLMSDMAPNMSGNKVMDQPRSIYLAELALDTAQTVLTKGGTFLIKMFQGSGFDEYKKQVASSFSSVIIRKPKSSRARSNEVYILAKGFK
ncbi:MAG: 23S rRNA (uridine(2552)-2'-O)-methyltransferase RlmE [Methylococcales symbiont of Hymedesmia sp. n. MRB-2018]|nr:MAG: 23S rRNA (uridine(2552)-2'-O)-methyltransferase RlmE [Methylococcales symbiont of Hymedesmia sp. n. MRB-2018]